MWLLRATHVESLQYFSSSNYTETKSKSSKSADFQLGLNSYQADFAKTVCSHDRRESAPCLHCPLRRSYWVGSRLGMRLRALC